MKYYSWLIRIAKRDEIDDMANGIFRFSLPKYWLKGGKGIFDKDEGICKKNNGEIFRRGNILDLPTICFYGIESKEDEFDIPQEYFRDFSKNTSDYSFIILEANSFYSELLKIFRLEYDNNKILRKGIDYVNKTDDFESEYDYPWELFYKNNNYSYQNEFRFVLNFNINSLEYLFLKQNNYKLKLNILNIQNEKFIIPEENEIVHVKKKDNKIDIMIM